MVFAQMVLNTVGGNAGCSVKGELAEWLRQLVANQSSLTRCVGSIPTLSARFGGLPEWLNGASWKGDGRKRHRGSTPLSSAR
jgi:hypothetical protein